MAEDSTVRVYDKMQLCFCRPKITALFLTLQSLTFNMIGKKVVSKEASIYHFSYLTPL